MNIKILTQSECAMRAFAIINILKMSRKDDFETLRWYYQQKGLNSGELYCKSIVEQFQFVESHPADKDPKKSLVISKVIRDESPARVLQSPW